MEKLRNLQSRDLALEVDRDRDQLIQQTMRQLNAHFGRRCTTTPMAVHRVKVTFKDEPGEGSGVARSFYTAIALALLSNDKLPNLDCVQSVSKGMQASSTCHHDYNSSMTIHRNYCTLWKLILFNAKWYFSVAEKNCDYFYLCRGGGKKVPICLTCYFSDLMQRLRNRDRERERRSGGLRAGSRRDRDRYAVLPPVRHDGKYCKSERVTSELKGHVGAKYHKTFRGLVEPLVGLGCCSDQKKSI